MNDFLIFVGLFLVKEKKTQNKREKSRNKKSLSSFSLPKQLLTHSTLNCHGPFFSLAKKSSFWQIQHTSSILATRPSDGQNKKKKKKTLHSAVSLTDKPQRKKKTLPHSTHGSLSPSLGLRQRKETENTQEEEEKSPSVSRFSFPFPLSISDTPTLR